MPTILVRIFLISNLLNSLLLYLVPKKLIRSFLPSSWFTHQGHQEPPSAPPPSAPPSSSLSLPPLPPPPSLLALKGMDPTEVKRVFQMFDKNGDGRITKKELSESLENLGIFIPDGELSQMIEKIDENGDGCVDIGEFESLYKSIMEGEANEDEEEQDMREAFNVFDQNGDGFITSDELKSILASLGLRQGKTAEDCKKMIMQVDVDGDGRVNYKEFRQMMKGGGFSAFST